MTISYEAVKDFIDYIEFWPDEDDPGFDGEHYGGWKKVRDDAPESAKKAYERFLKEQDSFEKQEREHSLRIIKKLREENQMQELKQIFNTEYDSIEQETQTRIDAFRDAIEHDKKLLMIKDENQNSSIIVEVDECGDEMTCIATFVDEDAKVLDEGRRCEWIDVYSIMYALILASEHMDAMFVGIEPGKGFVINKALAQRILEPFHLNTEYDKSDEERLNEAIKFATSAHEGQFRKGTNTPYIVHPLEVMNILQSMDADTNLLIAGLLHDVVEDAGVKIPEIDSLFGADVASLVAAHSENKNWRWETRKKNCICDIEYGSDRFRMLVMADTVANQRAILHDLRFVGDKVWERFRKGKDLQAWYYSSKQDALESMQCDEHASKVYWEMVDGFKDIFVDYFLNVSDHKLYQLSAVQMSVFNANKQTWESIQEDEKVKGIPITRIFAETVEDAWRLPLIERRQWKDWMFFEDNEQTPEDIVRMIVDQLKNKGITK